MSKTASWGHLKNGKFDGMIGALVRKQADIGGSPIFFRIERAKVIDYTTRTWVARWVREESIKSTHTHTSKPVNKHKKRWLSESDKW